MSGMQKKKKCIVKMMRWIRVEERKIVKEDERMKRRNPPRKKERVCTRDEERGRERRKE